MASQITIKVEGKTYGVLNLALSLSRLVNDGGTAASAIRGGTLSFSIPLEQETNSDAFFASWMAAKETHAVELECSNYTGENVFLTIKLEQANCVGYAPSYSFPTSSDISNTTLEIILASPKIKIGQAPFTLDQL